MHYAAKRGGQRQEVAWLIASGDLVYMGTSDLAF
jgi:hypothetical protein